MAAALTIRGIYSVTPPMKKLWLASCVIGAAAVVAGAAQDTPSPVAPTFEVATVKPNKSGERGGSIRRLPGGRVTVTNMAPRILITFAYQLAQFQLVGGPAWLDTDKFDMVAKLQVNPESGMPGLGPDPLPLAMRTLLTDRFKLKAHRETRQMDIYALVMLKPGAPGPALRPSTTDCKAMADAARRGAGPPPGLPATGPVPCGIVVAPAGTIRFDGFPISQATALIGGMAGRMVVERTGLTGNWQFVLTFGAEQRGQPPPGPETPAPDPNAPSLFTALQEQLGLKLEPTKGPVEVLVIDSIDQPMPD